MDAFNIDAMVHGYHVYLGIWDADLAEQLPYQRKPMNSKNPLAVAVMKSQVTIGPDVSRKCEGHNVGQ